MGGAGYGIFGYAGFGGEEARNEIDVVTLGGNDDAAGHVCFGDGFEVWYGVGDGCFVLVDQEVVGSALVSFERLRLEPCSHFFCNIDGLQRICWEVELDEVALSGD